MKLPLEAQQTLGTVRSAGVVSRIRSSRTSTCWRYTNPKHRSRVTGAGIPEGEQEPLPPLKHTVAQSGEQIRMPGV